jgi:monoterpene epsilon-lactone hydrolase
MAKFFRYIENTLADKYQERKPIPNDFIIREVAFKKFSVEWQIPPNRNNNQVLLYIHGGGFILGSINDHRLLTVELAHRLKHKVLSINYRLAPENKYPAHLNDCVAAYMWLLSEQTDPKNIIIAGDSAGGNLTLTTLLKLKEENLPMPRGAICLSPVTDLTFTDTSFYLNSQTDPILADVGVFWWNEAYINGMDPLNPLISPLFADLNGLPPILLQTSSCEMLYNDSKRFAVAAKSAGIDVTLQVWDDMPHVFQMFGLNCLSEAEEAIENINKFVMELYW